MMNAGRTVLSLESLLQHDLDYVCGTLDEEFTEMAGKQLLITGGAGFLGYYLVHAALHWNRSRTKGQRISVMVYDNYARGVPGWLKSIEKEPGLTLVRHDMTRPLPPGMGHFDYIVHAAGIASPKVYRKHPLACIDANIVGLRNLLDYSVAERLEGRPISGFLFYSSSEIYGDPSPDAIPTPESYRGSVSCTGPRACYDESKRFGETLCVTFAQAENLPVKIARPFNNYGPGLKITDGRVIPDFCRDVLAGRDIVMLSDGSPTRTFCYAADAIIGYYKVLVRGQRGESYNVGIERPEISMRQLAECVVSTARELLGYAGKVVLGTSQESAYLVDNPNRRCPSIAKAREQLDFAPRVDIAEGIYRTICWYQHYPSADEEQ
jgi:UDP-glucuronate decarboxylase